MLILGLLKRILQLSTRLSQSLLNSILSLGTPTPQTSLQSLHARRLNKHIAGLDTGVLLDLLHAIHLDIQNNDQTLGSLLVNGHVAGSIAIRAESGALDETAFGLQCCELVLGDEEVALSVDFAGAGTACCVRDAEGELGGVCAEEALDECALADT